MTNSQIYPYKIALHIAQQAVAKLVAWANAKLPDECQITEDSDAIKRAKCILHWPSDAEPKPLSLLFDSVKLSDSKGQSEVHYWKAEAIANEHPTIPYPQPEKPTDTELNKLKSEIKQALNQLESNWNNLSLLTLIIEKFGSCLSFGDTDVALIDMARSTAAVAAALVNNPEANHLSLVAGDLSGIQKFIYTISSDGALKSLRARSFYLELVTEEIVQQLLTELGLPRTNVIYAGGGNLYLLAPTHENTKTVVLQIQTTFNQWLLNKFKAKIFLALAASDPFAATDVATDKFAEHWDSAIKAVNQQKSCKFINQISNLFELKRSYEQRCRVCHRDDTPNLKEVENDDGELIIQCPTCQKMSQLGSQLFKTRVVVRSRRADLPGKLGKISFQFAHYYIFESQDNLPQLQEEETVFHINNWEIKRYHFKNSVSLLLGNYGKVLETEEEGKHFIRAGEMADAAKKAGCIPRVGYLRMDVDKLGQIFAKGLDEKQTLPRLAGLSRQMSYFFKVYLNSLANDRETNFLKPNQLKKTQCLSKDERQNLLFIYAGGDDLFVSGAWNEVVEFAFDVYQSFRAYTGNNPDITLSGGLSLADVKFPLYQAATESGKAEDAAKSNGRDSLGLFGEKFKWSEWLGRTNIKVSEIEIFDSEIKDYLEGGSKIESLELFGILPFIQILEEPEIGYSRSFVRNLLDTANLQSQKIKEIEDGRKQEEYTNQKKDIRYYLHLPQIAYTLARLPKNIRENQKFEPVRKSLKSPYNAPYFRAIATWIELLNRSSNS